MPVKIQVNTHNARPWNRGSVGQSASALLCETDPNEYMQMGDLMGTSFTSAYTSSHHLAASQNGFLYSAINAYHAHHNLILRPEDIWFSILTQLSFYINRNAERLRSFFVAHEGRNTLQIWHRPGLGTKDNDVDKQSEELGQRPKMFVDEICENIKDPKLREWIMPDFSTTTPTDTVVASILMMGSLQAYFIYRDAVICGIPNVTLQGTRSDWVKLIQRVDFLPELGEEPAQFKELLKPVLERFVYSFDNPDDEATRAFWNRIAYDNEVRMCGGVNFLTGWITAFAFWNGKGGAMYRPRAAATGENGGTHLDHVRYHSVNLNEVPYGFTGIPVIFDEENARLVAGSVAVEKVDEETIRPVSGWWMYRLKEDLSRCCCPQGLQHSARADEIVHACKCPPPGPVPEEIHQLEMKRTKSVSTDVAEHQSVSGTTLAGSTRSRKWRKSVSDRLLGKSSWLYKLSGRAA